MSFLQQNQTSGCFFCNSTDNVLPCEYCDHVQTCEKHLQVHRPSDKCLPFKILIKEGVGRCVVAARDILAGEVIIEDKAAMIGPACRENVCLECLAPIPKDTKCQSCGLPLCCEGPRHKLECEVMKGWKIESNLSLYMAVGVVRGLTVDSFTQELIYGLMDHIEDRRDDDGKEEWDWKNVEVQVIDRLLACGVKHDKLAMERLAGIYLTNNVSCAANKGGDENGFGLFPIFSILSHSCLANTRRCVNDEKMTVRATIPFKSGQEVLTSYNFSDLGSVARRPQYRSTWYFDCACERCSDPTEFGTFLSCLNCSMCRGSVMPEDSLDYDSSWVCGGCCNSITASDALDTTEEVKKKCDECKETIEDMEILITELLNICHPNHYLLMQMKMNLALMYGNTENSSMTLLTDKQLARKVSLCQEWMEVMGKVDRGFTLTRGRLCEEVAKSKLEMIKRSDMTKIQLLMEMREVMKLVKEVGKCKQFENEEEQKQFARRAKAMILS